MACITYKDFAAMSANSSTVADSHISKGLPLAGIAVIDLTHAIFGALAARLLADFGANVIKIENPHGGDFNRGRAAGLNLIAGLDSPRFSTLNYNKRSVALDLKAPEVRPAFEAMIRKGDVVIHNQRPQVAKKLGFDAESVHALNPRAVYCALSAYGDDGPLAHRRGGDPYAQALSGVVAAQGSRGQPPYLGFTTWVDHGGAALAALGVAMAVMERERTGEGQVVGTSLLDVALYFQSSSALADVLVGGPPVIKGGRGASGAFPWGAYPASDGDVVIFLGYDDLDFSKLSKAIGRPELPDDSRFANDAQRRINRDALYQIMDEELQKRTREEWAEIFSEHGVRADPALTHEEMLVHPQVINNEMISACPSEGGPDSFMTIANPLRLGGDRPTIRSRPPDIGEHTREVLHEFGVPQEDIARCFAAGALSEPGH